jgi:hypothetical protein
MQNRNRRKRRLKENAYVYPTPSGAYQVKKWNGEKVKCYGTYHTFEEASAVAETLYE